MLSMYDVIIVGAGVGGSHLASKLKGNVLVLEKDKKIKPKDSGIVSKNFLNFFGKEFIKDKISEMKVMSPSGNVIFLQNRNEPMAYIIKRESFAAHLHKIAKKHADFRKRI